jgi:hypothetical protein
MGVASLMLAFGQDWLPRVIRKISSKIRELEIREADEN